MKTETYNAGRFEGKGRPKRTDYNLARIGHYPWDENGCRPESSGGVLWNGAGLHVYLESSEGFIRAVNNRHNSPVNEDSCLEFFINPFPEYGVGYLNFEFNPLGFMHLGLGEGREKRTIIPPECFEQFQIKTELRSEDGVYDWRVSFFIPFGFLEERYERKIKIAGKAAFPMKGNFYKCGDLTEKPHFGCWNEVIKEKPDFHRPEFFGNINLLP